MLFSPGSPLVASQHMPRFEGGITLEQGCLLAVVQNGGIALEQGCLLTVVQNVKFS